MCHHWADETDAEWEQLLEDVKEDDPETQEPEPTLEMVDPPLADDD